MPVLVNEVVEYLVEEIYFKGCKSVQRIINRSIRVWVEDTVEGIVETAERDPICWFTARIGC